MSEEYRGPRIGDTVTIEVTGVVHALQGRQGVPGVEVWLEDGRSAWAPLDATVVVRRSGDADVHGS